MLSLTMAQPGWNIKFTFVHIKFCTGLVSVAELSYDTSFPPLCTGKYFGKDAEDVFVAQCILQQTLISPSVYLEFEQLNTGRQFATAQEPDAIGNNNKIQAQEISCHRNTIHLNCFLTYSASYRVQIRAVTYTVEHRQIFTRCDCLSILPLPDEEILNDFTLSPWFTRKEKQFSYSISDAERDFHYCTSNPFSISLFKQGVSFGTTWCCLNAVHCSTVYSKFAR